MENIKTYKYTLDQNFALTCVSCVEEPATESNYDFCSKNKENFEEVDGNVMGVIALCGVPIPRVNSYTGEYYNIVFDKATCDELARQLIRKGAPLSLDHVSSGTVQAELTGVFQTNKYFKYNDAPDGSVVVSYKASPAVIEELKKRNGFSMEIYFGDVEPFSKVDEILTFIDNA